MFTEAVARRCSVKKVFLEIFQSSQEIHRPQACNFIKKETLAQMFSSEFWKIFKVLVTHSDILKIYRAVTIKKNIFRIF